MAKENLLKGKDLTVGMAVLVYSAHKRCKLAANSGQVFTVDAINYPFAVMTTEYERPSYGIWGLVLMQFEGR